MEDRKPINDQFDAVIDLATSSEAVSYAYVIFKFTYSFHDNYCRPAAPEPLFHDLRNEEIQPRMRSDSDFWNTKDKTDVVVRGSAHASQGKAVPSMMVSAQVGDRPKHVRVFGHRDVKWNGEGKPRIESPQLFTEVPLTFENAYGGLDWRVIDKTVPLEQVAFRTERDHPGMYPRNPFGKGYLVESGEVPEMAMPHLENPHDLLTEERLIVGDPRRWYLQPIPWCFDWTHLVTYPRYLYADSEIDAWYPAPENVETAEMQQGYLERNYRELMTKWGMLSVGPAPQFYQGASHGMVFDGLPTGCPITISGMHPTEQDTVLVARNKSDNTNGN